MCVFQKCMGLPQKPACSAAATDVYSNMAAMTNDYVTPAAAKAAADDKDVSYLALPPN